MRTPDPTRCPQCTAVLASGDACSACGLQLSGPAAVRLWQVDTELLALDEARVPLLAERSTLLAALRGTPPATPVLGPVVAAPAPAVPVAEVAPQRVQNALLGLGGLLLAVAALVFAAVTYERLGAGGRAAVLLALTAAAAAAAPVALRRGLRSTAETLAGVALVLAVLDAYGLRRLGIGDGLGESAFTAVSSGVLAALAGAYAAVVPLRLPAVAAVALSQLVLPGLLVEAQAGAPLAGALLALQAGVDVAATALLRRGPRRTLAWAAAASGGAALAGGLVAAFDRAEDAGRGALVLLLLAAVLGAAAAVTERLRPALGAAGVVLVGVAAHAATRLELTEPQLPLVPAAVALLAVQAAAMLPRPLRPGPVLGGALVAAGAVAAVAEPVVTGAAGPLLWVLEPWTAATGATTRDALSPQDAWSGTVVTPAVLAAAAVVAVGAGLALHRLREAAVPAALLGALAALLLPLGLDLPLLGGLLLLVALATLALHAPRPAVADLPAAAAGAAVLLLAAVWSLAREPATLVVLPLAALVLAGAAVRSARLAAPTAALAGGLAAGTVAAAGASAGLATDQVGALLVAAVAALLLAAAPGTGPARAGLEAAAGVTALAALAAASRDAGWLSWSLAGLAVAALAGALRPDRRLLAVAGAVLLSGSSWVRLADAGVGAPEPYVVPLALVVLALGHLRRRAVPSTGSFAAYGPGLTALLVPSLLASLAGDSLLRPLVLAGVALAVLLAGVREGLRAPLVVGGTVLAADAVLLLAPYAAALPRWLALGSAGTLLVLVGATYEARLRDLARLRGRYDALA